MSRFKVTTREIGSVRIFDLSGDPNQEALHEVAWKIQRNIRRFRLQRVILNVQKVKSLDEIGIRELIAACLRPQRSIFYGASGTLASQLSDTYLPSNVKVCPTEREVAEDFGPFLFRKDDFGKLLPGKNRADGERGPGLDLERRRSKRMHVAIPLEVVFFTPDKDSVSARGIATNISEGGIFVEFLDLETLKVIEDLSFKDGQRVEITIHPSGNFPEMCRVGGEFLRKEVRKGGLGLAIRFTSKPSELFRAGLGKEAGPS